MTDVRLLRLLAQQLDITAWWQLRALGWSPRRIDSTVRRRHWQVVHDGVYAAKYAPLTRMQRWIAATLTEPGTLLAGASAGACWGFRPWEASFETVVRWGSGGPRMFDDLWVSRSLALADDVAWFGPVPCTSAERTLIDLSPGLSPVARAKAVREAVRLGVLTLESLGDALDRHRRRRGVAALRQVVERYARSARVQRPRYHHPGGESGRSRLAL